MRRNSRHPMTVVLAAHQLDSYRLGACQLVDHMGVVETEHPASGASGVAASAAATNRSLLGSHHNRLHHRSATTKRATPTSSSSSSSATLRTGAPVSNVAQSTPNAVVAQHLAPMTGSLFANNNCLAHQQQALDPQAAAQAMVGAARATLVILMGVLVTKLILSSKKQDQKSNSRRSNHQQHYNPNQIQSTRQHITNQSFQETNQSTGSLNITSQNYHQQHQQAQLPSQLPPGPRGLPFLGYLPFLGPELHLSLTQLSNRYGPIYQIYLGSIRVVVLTDASLVRQAFRQPVFSGRPDTQLTRILQGYGIVNSDGALWREQRAFLHSALRKLGLKSLMGGSNGLEAKIQNQVREFVDDLSQHANSGKSCELRPFVARSVSSVVGSIVMNSIYQMDGEKKFDRLIELMEEGFKLFAIAMPLDFIPILRFLPSVSWAYKKIKQNRHETSAFFNEFADQHRKYLSETYNLRFNNESSPSELHPIATQQTKPTNHSKQAKKEHDITAPAPPSATTDSTNNQQTVLTVDSNTTKTTTSHNETISHNNKESEVKQLDDIVARDLVDAYIIQQKRHEAHGKQSYFSDQQLIQIMSDIFSAGLETVTSTIDWSILFMMLNPDCQKRVQAEIDDVIGRDRLPELNDLAKMPYTEATIFEVLRRSNVVPLGNAHATLENAEIGGYFIPKGTQVLPNLYGMNMDAKLWNEPEKFEPIRFLVGNQERAQKPDHFIPFSVGRRVCLGDLLAKMEVFLFLTGLLQKFNLSVASEDRDKPPKIEGTIGLSNAPVPFRVAISSRTSKH